MNWNKRFRRFRLEVRFRARKRSFARFGVTCEEAAVAFRNFGHALKAANVIEALEKRYRERRTS